jgi:hypothetical protein
MSNSNEIDQIKEYISKINSNAKFFVFFEDRSVFFSGGGDRHEIIGFLADVVYKYQDNPMFAEIRAVLMKRMEQQKARDISRVLESPVYNNVSDEELEHLYKHARSAGKDGK